MPVSGNKYKLLLINPVNKRRHGLKLVRDSIYPPMALGILAAMSPENWEVEIIDENFSTFEYQDADLVALTSLTATINRCYEIATEYRKNRIPTIIGGIHASMMPKEAIEYVDSVVVGEAESIWGHLLHDFEKGQLKKFYHASLASFSNAPSPKISLYNSGYKFGSVQTTRGCPMSCDFCSVHGFNGSKYRLRSVDESVHDFISNDKDLIYIVDDNFVGYSKAARDHALDFFKGIYESGVKKNWGGSASMNIAEDEELLRWAAKSGCKFIFLGIESELIEQLEKANKKINIKLGTDKYGEVYDKIHKHSISVMGAFIYGLENDTPESIYNRTSYMLDADIDIMQATILTPLPGTELYRRLHSEGKLLHTNYPEDWERYNYTEVVFKPNKMSPQEFEEAVYSNWERLYELKKLKGKFLKTLKLTKDPTAAVWAINSNLQMRNFVLEGRKEALDIDSAFPGLLDSIKLR